MTEARAAIVNRPAWVDLSSSDAAASRDFYSKLFGWRVEVSPDPQYGGYGIAKVDGEDVAGIGPKMSPKLRPPGRSTSARMTPTGWRARCRRPGAP